MRWIGPGTIVLAGLALLSLPAPPAHADPYRWCAIYGDQDMGATNCGFVTYRQCLATISGIGGRCEPNPFYDGRTFDGSEIKPYRRHHRYRHD